MKRYLFFLFFISLFALPSLAQKNGDKESKEAKRKEMLNMKIDYLASEIELKDDQKKQFAELYAQMETEKRAVLKKMKKAEKTISENKDASESDYEKASNEIASAKNEMLQIEQRYDEKFSSFLSKKQMFKLKEAENSFMQKVKKCRDKKKK